MLINTTPFNFLSVTVRVGFQFGSYTVGEGDGQLFITIDIDTVENEEPERATGISLSYLFSSDLQHTGW